MREKIAQYFSYLGLIPIIMIYVLYTIGEWILGKNTKVDQKRNRIIKPQTRFVKRDTEED